MLIFYLLVFSEYCIFSDACFKLSKVDGNMKVVMTSKIKGWIGFGIGSDMQGDIVIGWVSGDKVYVSNRKGTGEQQPTYSVNSALNITSTSITNDGFVIEFIRPITATNGFMSTAELSYFGAYKEQSISCTNLDCNLSQHLKSSAQNFHYNLDTGESSASDHSFGLILLLVTISGLLQ
eukprot:NODE_345_length_9042_cov_0.258973.p6 type:complete len:178 gc:universal NODE_345_length_9042_cov_0.258973:4099-4632(+)